MVGSEKLVRYSLLAGERALSAYANEEAVEHFERALAAKEGQPPSGQAQGRLWTPRTAALLFGLGRARAATVPWDEMHHAVTPLSRAFDYYVESGDVARAVAITEYPKDIAQFLSGMDELGRLVDRALELVPAGSREAGGPPGPQVRVLGVLRNDYEGAQEALGRALAIARRDNDGAGGPHPVQRHRCGDLSSPLPGGAGDVYAPIELAQSLDDPYAEANGHYWAAMILTAWGEPAQGEAARGGWSFRGGEATRPPLAGGGPRRQPVPCPGRWRLESCARSQRQEPVGNPNFWATSSKPGIAGIPGG